MGYFFKLGRFSGRVFVFLGSSLVGGLVFSFGLVSCGYTVWKLVERVGSFLGSRYLGRFGSLKKGLLVS